MIYKRTVSAEDCLCMNGDMSLLTFLGFSTVLSINAVCPGNMPQKNLPVDRMVPVSIADKSAYNRVPRQTIIEAITIGQPTTNEEFQRTLNQLLVLNLSYPITEGDLSLWISSLIARRENPRNQHGIDMVADLLTRVGSMSRPRPYLALTLCNAHAIKEEHLDKVVKWNSHRSNYTHPRDLELHCLVLKTLACAASLPAAQQQNLDKFADVMQEIAKKISFAYTNGIYFDNIYTTSLVVQAMTAYNLVIDATLQWGEQQALDSLRKESAADSVAKRYYIVMGLNARRIPFIKDLHKQSYDTQLTLKKDIHLTLSLKNEEQTDMDFAVQLKVPIKWNLFEVLQRASNFSSRFRFVHSLNRNGEPLITEVDGIPNDPERGIYWMICTSERTDTFASPTLHSPFDGETITLWYRSTDCSV